MTAPFAVHPNDEKRAKEYRAEAKAIGLQWPDIEADIREYLTAQNVTADFMEEQVGRAKKFFKA